MAVQTSGCSDAGLAKVLDVNLYAARRQSRSNAWNAFKLSGKSFPDDLHFKHIFFLCNQQNCNHHWMMVSKSSAYQTDQVEVRAAAEMAGEPMATHLHEHWLK